MGSSEKKFSQTSIQTKNIRIIEVFRGVKELWGEGLSERAVVKELESRLEKDFTFDSGRILGSMCTKPHHLAAKVYTRFLEKNLGDMGLFPGVAELEEESIEMIGALLSNPQASGHIVTGGTEANILALWAAKKMIKKEKSEIILPISAHCSFDKAADLLGFKTVRVGLDSEFRVDVNAVKRAINATTVAIVGIAGTTGLGAVDPINELSEVAVENGLYLHVDAAFGGFILPFLRELGYELPSFDFNEEGVCSITVDPHKMGLAPIPAGGILFRNKKMRDAITWNISYLAGGESKQATLVGTRSGASIIAVWALLKHLGREGYTRIVKRCMRLTQKLAKEIPAINGMDVMVRPTLNVVGLTSRTLDIRQVAQELRGKGWAISLFPKHIRIVVMPHVQEQHVDDFLKDLKAVASKLRR